MGVYLRVLASEAEGVHFVNNTAPHVTHTFSLLTCCFEFNDAGRSIPLLNDMRCTV